MSELVAQIGQSSRIMCWFCRNERGAYEAPLGVFGIRDIRVKNYQDTGYLRKRLLGYRILRSSFRDTGYSQKIIVTIYIRCLIRNVLGLLNTCPFLYFC